MQNLHIPLVMVQFSVKPVFNKLIVATLMLSFPSGIELIHLE